MPKPTKEQLRKWLEHNREQHRPPPSAEETKQELDWHLPDREINGEIEK